MSSRIEIMVFVTIILLGAFFRFYLIKETPLGLYPDEAMNGNNALEALETGQFKWFYPENNGREGLFINIQALAVKVFGNEPWALRGVSVLLGTLTILGIYLLTKELLRLKSNLNHERSSTSIALLSSFFLATSYWHINFSRIGFRAILIPLVSTLAMYFLLKGLRRGNIWDMVWAGIFAGLGFHTYIAFRFMPFVLAVPVIGYLWRWLKSRSTSDGLPAIKSCVPCLVLLFLLVSFVVALPVGYYFLQHPEDFIGRSGQVSVFSADQPLKEFLKSNGATWQMFFYQGDCNWRHNYACEPQLHWLAAVFFIIGTFYSIYSVFKKTLHPSLLLAWLFFMSLPATLTREGLPHALRSIGMIPPVMILSGLGAWLTLEKVLLWFEKQKSRWPQYVSQLSRIQKEIAILLVLILLIIPLATFKNYFLRWAHHANTYFAFTTDLVHLGKYLDQQPPTAQKYVIVNLPGVEVRGIPMPAQTVMFITDTFTETKQKTKNISYVLPGQLEFINTENKKTIIAPLNGGDRELVKKLREKFPDFKIHAPSDFIVLETK